MISRYKNKFLHFLHYDDADDDDDESIKLVVAHSYSKNSDECANEDIWLVVCSLLSWCKPVFELCGLSILQGWVSAGRNLFLPCQWFNRFKPAKTWFKLAKT